MPIGRAAADRAGARPYVRRRPSGRSLFGTLLGQGWAQTLLILAPFATDPDVEFQKMGCTRDTWVVVADRLLELAGELLLGQIRRLKTMKKWRVVSNGLNHPGRLLITGTAGAELQYERL